MPDGLYERDALLWSEQQAGLLRRLAAGERLNDAVDWPNVIEEVEALGRLELRACESLLLQAMLHLLKLHAWPSNAAGRHWQGEVDVALFEAGRAFSPSMRQRIDIASLYAVAVRRVVGSSDEYGPLRPMPETCPYGLDELLADNPDIAVLVRRL